MSKEYYGPNGEKIIKWFSIGKRRIPVYEAKPDDMPGGPGTGHKIETEFDFDDPEVDEEEQMYEKQFNHNPVNIKRFENGLKRLDIVDASSQWAYIENIQKAMRDVDETERKKLKKLYNEAMKIVSK